jgi:hypothetical protein
MTSLPNDDATPALDEPCEPVHIGPIVRLSGGVACCNCGFALRDVTSADDDEYRLHFNELELIEF